MAALTQPHQKFITRHLFLAVAEEKARAVLQQRDDVLLLDNYGQASMVVLLFLMKQDTVDVGHAERMLADLAVALEKSDDQDVLSLLGDIPASPDQAIDQVKEKGIHFLSSDELARKRYLVNGHWNWDLQNTHGQALVEHTIGSHPVRATSDQIRTLTTLLAEPDEAMDVQGFAGTGKTHLIAHVLRELPGRFTYFAPRSRQHEGQVAHLRTAGGPPLTLNVLATDMLREFRWDSGRRIQRHRTQHVSLGAIAAALGIGPVADMSAIEVVRTCMSAIQRFCWTDASDIRDEHFNRVLPLGFVDLAVIRAHAARLWQFMVEQPSPEYQVPLREYHIAKLLDLEGRTVPRQYGALLVDEVHDMSPTWRRILARSPHGYVTFGDRYQFLGQPSSSASTSGRQRMLERSVRLGQNAAPMVNSILGAHPWQPETEFIGSQAHTTRIRRYPTAPLPPMQEGLVLFAEAWALIEFIQRCAHAAHENSFNLLPSSREELRRMVSGLTDLHRRNERPSYAPLQGFSTWDGLRRHYQHHTEATRIVHLFEKGYDRTAFERAVARETQGQAKLTLGLLVDGKNLQSDVVVLAPDLFRDRGAKANAETVASIYIAATRARYELWMPECGREWVEEHSSTRRIR